MKKITKWIDIVLNLFAIIIFVMLVVYGDKVCALLFVIALILQDILFEIRKLNKRNNENGRI